MDEFLAIARRVRSVASEQMWCILELSRHLHVQSSPSIRPESPCIQKNSFLFSFQTSSTQLPSTLTGSANLNTCSNLLSNFPGIEVSPVGQEENTPSWAGSQQGGCFLKRLSELRFWRKAKLRGHGGLFFCILLSWLRILHLNRANSRWDRETNLGLCTFCSCSLHVLAARRYTPNANAKLAEFLITTRRYQEIPLDTST